MPRASARSWRRGSPGSAGYRGTAVAEVRPAATIALIRDGATEIETLVFIRPVKAEFAARAQVFPGGRIDEDDADAGWSDLVGLDEGGARGLLGSDHELGEPPALALLVGAVRELFEESAMLLGAPSGLDRAWLHAARDRLHTGSETFIDLVRERDIRLDLSGMVNFARWVTPAGSPRRYDARFLAAVAPPGQEASPAPGEVEQLEWLTPGEAMRRARDGEAYTMPPTIAALEAISGRGNGLQTLDHLRRHRDLRPIVPKLVAISNDPPSVQILMPGDAGYDEA
ncbi:MAG: NUDIX hydrolase [Candidatus Dormibacteria bacterium]